MLRTFAYKEGSRVFEPLLTAAEGFPAFEREFLSAKSEIWASFRVFDPETILRSPEARAVGERWFDLIVHTLARGVRLNLAIADFDPVAMPALHRATWRSVRRIIAAAELSNAPDRLRIVAAMHPASTGFLPRLMFWPVILARKMRLAAQINRQAPAVRQAMLKEMPGVPDRFAQRSDGTLRPTIWPLPRLYPATHHQKIAVFDRCRLYIGGLDLDERRFDTLTHACRAEETWHDVQLLLSGLVVEEAQEHVETFLDVTAGRREPTRPKRLLRTLSRPRARNLLRFGPDTIVQEIASAHEHCARNARRLIYLETQYFRDLRLARYLARIGAANPDLGMIMMLPGAPEEIAFDRRVELDARFGEFLQSRALRIVGKAVGRRLFVGAAAQPRDVDGAEEGGNGRDQLCGAPIVYIHSKVSIFDETSAIVSSANLNGRSLRWDTEAGVLITERANVQALRRKVMAHWLPAEAGPAFFDTVRAVPAWRQLALENTKRRPSARAGFLLPYDLSAAERFATGVPVLPEEMV